MNTPPNREVALFSAALELPAGQRAAYLDEACAGDPALRLHLESLLRVHEEAGAFLETPASGAQASPMGAEVPGATPPVTGAPSEKAGDRIGRYKLLQQIGEGGCGVVYMAEQEEPVRRQVALKVIKLGMDTRRVIARFEAERQALALMDHPNIAKVLDAGATNTGGPYFVMELVRGVRITDYCDENHLSTRERLELFVQVCRAIQHAHQKGVIHRDIKPSNILVTVNDGAAVPKVIDFGIAKATGGQPLTDKTLFTAFEQFLGTPAYMSPEQAVMTSLDIDTRSDIYSLGVLLYELLTSQTPFDAKALLAAGLDAMRRTIREQEPARPSTRLSTMLQGELATAASHRRTGAPELIHLVRGDLDWIVMKALEKDRARRYETANGLAMDVQRYLADEPIVARPPSNLYRFQKMVRRNKLPFAAASAVAAALVLGLGFSIWQFIEKSRAEREQTRLREAAQSAQATEAQLRRQAEVQELASRRKTYASDMNLVQQSLAVNNLGRAQELLGRHKPQPGQLDLRGWEWRYLWQQCRNGSLFTLCRQSNEICSLAVSFDGKWLVVGEHDQGGLSIYDLQTRQEVTRLPAGNHYVFAAFSPRQLLLAFSGTYGPPQSLRDTVRLWDGATQQVMVELPLGGPCRGVAFSGDGQTLITSTFSEITLWRVPDGKKLASYPAKHDYHDDVPQLAVARDLSVAAHGTSAGQIRVVDLATGMQRWRAESGDEHVITLAFSPDGRILASGAGFSGAAIRLWDVASGKEIGRLEGHRGYVQALVFWPDGKTLASASSDQTICLWDLADLTKVPPPRTLRGHKREVRRLALLPGNTRLVSACEDGSVYVWDTVADRSTGTKFTIKMPRNFTTLDRAWCFAPDGKSILKVDPRGRLMQCQGAEFQEMVPLLQLGTKVHGARFSDDGQLAAVGSTDGIIRVWDLPHRTLLHEFTASGGPVSPLQFLAQGRRLLIHCQSSEDVHEWDLMSCRETRSWPAGPLGSYLWNAGCSQDGRWFFLARTERPPPILSDLRANPVRTRNLDIAEVSDADLSPDGQLLAAASHAGYARLWETETLREVSTFSDFLQGVNSVAFSRNGKRLATGSDGKEAIKLWDVDSHEELLTLEGQGSQFFSIMFSADDNLLGAQNALRVLHVWRAPSWGEIEAVEKAQQAGQ